LQNGPRRPVKRGGVGLFVYSKFAGKVRVYIYCCAKNLDVQA